MRKYKNAPGEHDQRTHDPHKGGMRGQPMKFTPRQKLALAASRGNERREIVIAKLKKDVASLRDRKESIQKLESEKKTGTIGERLERNKKIQAMKNDYRSLVNEISGMAKGMNLRFDASAYAMKQLDIAPNLSEEKNIVKDENVLGIEETIRLVTEKHMQGKHEQKRHGWRYGGLAAARRSMRGQPKAERDEYRKRAGMQEPKKVVAQATPVSTPKPENPIEKRMAFDERAERANIFKPNGLLQEGRTRADARGFQRVVEIVRNAKGADWEGKGVAIRDYVNSLIGRGFRPKRVEGSISLVNGSGQVIKIPSGNRRMTEDYLNFLFQRGEFATTKERKDFQSVDIYALKHLRGQHDQKTHGHRGGWGYYTQTSEFGNGVRSIKSSAKQANESWKAGNEGQARRNMQNAGTAARAIAKQVSKAANDYGNSLEKSNALEKDSNADKLLQNLLQMGRTLKREGIKFDFIDKDGGVFSLGSLTYSVILNQKKWSGNLYARITFDNLVSKELLAKLGANSVQEISI